MASIVVKRVKLQAKEYDKRRRKLKPDGVTLTLQTKNGEDLTFTSLTPVISSGFYYSYDSFREKLTVKIATLDTTIAGNIKKASDALIGSDRYEIDTRDILPPDADRPYWQFKCTMSQENY